MARVILGVLDSVGIGGAPDAERYDNDGTPDTGSNTLLHIALACERGECDGRAEYGQSPSHGPLHLPGLKRLGLGEALRLASGECPRSLEAPTLLGQYASAIETSNGKDTPSGHYEICGVPVDFDWGYFPKTIPTFPDDLIQQLVERCGLTGVLGNKHSSGTVIIQELGEAHMQSGMPIVYTSADSVFQIAAHEGSFGLDRRYQVCEVARELCDPLNIGRVIARPFVGDDAQSFERTANRKDYAVPPPGFNLLDAAKVEGREVIAVGKIGDIFAHRGTTQEIKVGGLKKLMDETLNAAREAKDGSLIFANFVDFDSKFGHRRDVAGYASALEYFDSRLGELIACLRDDDLLILTADHGNDPSWVGTDHTREQVPVLIYGRNQKPGSLGTFDSLTLIAQRVATHLRLQWRPLCDQVDFACDA